MTKATVEKLGEKAFVLLRRMNKVARDNLESWEIDNDDPQKYCLAQLYSAVLKLSESQCILLDRDIGDGVPALLRSMLEAQADFVCLDEDSDYWNYMYGRSLKKGVTILNCWPEKVRPADYKRVAEAYSAKLDEVKKHNPDYTTKLLNVVERFKRAGMADVYDTAYRELCLDTHNDIASVFRKNSTISDGDIESNYNNTISLEQLRVHLTHGCCILLEMSQRMHKQLGGNPSPEEEAIATELSELKVGLRQSREH